jgi:hypothetical protein
MKIIFFTLVLTLTGCNKGNDIQDRAILKLVDNPNRIEVQSSNRFQLNPDPPFVIDTITGQVWRISGSAGQGYYFTRVCYKSGVTKTLVPTPYEDELPNDPQKNKVLCSQ